MNRKEIPNKKGTTVNTATHPQRVAPSSPPQSLPTTTHAYRHTEQETEKQCTGNTQRRSPPAAAGVTAGASLFAARHHTTKKAHTQIDWRNAKEHDRPPQHRRLQPVVLQLPPKNSEITPHSRRILCRQNYYKRNTSAGAAVGRESIGILLRHHQCHTIHWLHAANIMPATCQRNKTRLSSLLARAAASSILRVRSQQSRRSTGYA
ncbi:exo-alpha-sialidase [Trypanosoma cruzi]|nr:exo-alpha-sialidase [Trypanosoma cruzi]